MPRELTSDWKLMINSGKKYDEAAEDLYKNNLNKLGNLLLIDNNANAGLKNFPFERKKQEYLKLNLILATIPFNTNSETILTTKSFTFDTIKNRTIKLSNILIEEIYEIK
ncbi:hypothetical protein SHELI_v1c03570 [Spiroplasma helicoides]|uniref:GmrSD restriction endonucleases C-terminal domain-containing protein n=2 Tax=Spiroplasma helicoides TaxID=216938 RepID=A0A1B3SK52_9MOLU|nr:hypothetical protein SHELI_v1c03570 [Spiroplasma helicoides]